MIIRFRVQIGINLHECGFQKSQIARAASASAISEIFEKFTDVNYSQIEREKPYDYLLIIYTKKFTEEKNDSKGHRDYKEYFEDFRACSQSF